jgi:predicted membrane protein
MAWQKLKARVIIGILLIVIGGLFLLNNYDIFLFPFSEITWEYFFILFGLLLFSLSNNKTAGVIFIAIGLFNLVPELWPIVFILLGLYIILRSKRGASYFHSSETATGQTSDAQKDFIEDVSIFGGGNKVYNISNFRGGQIVSIFGGSDINLTGSKLAEGDNSLEITAIFGGTTIIIPADWKVESDVLSIFGGFSDKRRKDPNLIQEPGKTLMIKGFVLFGGGEIKNYF